ncbi:uncharacterized protein LOC125946798 [Dermacentor silvarum]|uniref:uncharacterized protein LOC125946798 n=1 Tax=Dermacentor silvarum TaxID=543639 RepID=UPI0021017609|nr:uncharacterized protein LOC125946798 [Dermacentor silvarum]
MAVYFALLLFCAAVTKALKPAEYPYLSGKEEQALRAQRCSTDHECSDGRICVPHHDVTIACRNASFCVRAEENNCDCLIDFTCRKMNCNKTKFECVKLKNLETRCHSYRGPYCSQDEICAYEKTQLKCILNCPCYGQYRAVCTRKLDKEPCNDGSVAVVTPGVPGYVCGHCLSESEVLTAERGH